MQQSSHLSQQIHFLAVSGNFVPLSFYPSIQLSIQLYISTGRISKNWTSIVKRCKNEGNTQIIPSKIKPDTCFVYPDKKSIICFLIPSHHRLLSSGFENPIFLSYFWLGENWYRIYIYKKCWKTGKQKGWELKKEMDGIKKRRHLGT